MRENTCCFTGHRQIPICELENIKNKIEEEITKLIKNGTTNFICGGAIGFDNLCGEIVSELKVYDKNIRLILALPCKNQDKYFNNEEKKKYENLVLGADEVIYTSESYFRGCMHKRNRFMVDNSKYIISYCTKNTGGSFYTREYAKKNSLTVIDI